MQRAITFTHHKLKREFIVSSKTKPQTLKALTKKALNLQSEIKYIRNTEGRWRLEELLAPGGPSGNEYEIILEE